MPYRTFGDIMAEKYPSFEWEALTVTTSDGYILTLHHVWKERRLDAEKGPILFQHGDQMDASIWLDEHQITAPIIEFAEEGYHVYMGNNRGTATSQGHETLNAIDDVAYWNFSFADMANDVRAFVDKMYEHAGNEVKGYYVGYSQGTTQMLIALTQTEEELAQKLERIILLAPCTVAGTETEADLSLYSMTGIDNLRSIGVYSVPTANWAMDRTLICHESTSAMCAFSRFFSADYPGVTSSKNIEHWNQNTAAQRFQPFVEDWQYPDVWSAPEYDLTSIKTLPISLVVGQNDDVCTVQRAVMLASELETMQGLIMMEGWDHNEFMVNSQPEYFDILLKEVLAEPADQPVTIRSITLPSASEAVT